MHKFNFLSVEVTFARFRLPNVQRLLQRYVMQYAAARSNKKTYSCNNTCTLIHQLNEDTLEISVNISGFSGSPGRSLVHGFHVHTYGTIAGGCGQAGGHFNPKQVPHGPPQNDAW